MLKKTQRLREPPLGVKIISIFCYITGVIVFFYGLLNFYSGIANRGITGVLFGLGILIAGIFLIVIGWNLWTGKNWARAFLVGLSTANILVILINIFQDRNFLRIIEAVAPIAVGWYLVFSYEAKRYFREA